MAWFADQGLVMYKDFLNFYFPLSTYFILPFLKATNWSLETGPALSLVIALITLIILFKTAKQFLSPLGTSISLFFFAALFYYFTTAIQYSGEAITGLFLILTMNRTLFFLTSKNQSRDIFIIGILISLTLLFNQISALALFVVTIFTLLSIRKSIKGLLILSTALTLPIFLVSFFFFRQGAFFDLINNNLFYYINYIRLARGSGNLLSLPWNEILIFYIPAIVGIYLVTALKLIPTALRPLLLLLLSISIATIPSIIFSVFHRHHFLYALPVLALLFGLVFELGIKSTRSLGKAVVLLASIFVMYQSLSTFFPWYLTRVTSGRNNYIANDILPGDSMHETVTWIKENTQTKDKLLVAGDGLFYFKAERLPSTKFFTVLPWHYKPVNQTAPLIEKSMPDYWVVSHSYLKRISSPEGWNSPDIAEFIRGQLENCYKKKATFPDWEIWQKNCS